MPTSEQTLRVLIVDDNRDGADALGLLVEALGHQVHVTYHGVQALEVATTFRPDLMLVDLVMPDMDGRDLVIRVRQIPAFARMTIVAVTGLKEDQDKALALQAGCDIVLTKPVALADMKAVLARVVHVIARPGRASSSPRARIRSGISPRLPIEEARRIRNGRPSKRLTQAESEAAICDGIICFQEEYLGWKSERVEIHFIKDLLVVRIREVLTLAERQLSKSMSPDKGRNLIKETRKHLLELARPMLESLVYEAASVKVMSMHHDLSTVTGEEMVIFSLTAAPRFEECS